MQIAWAIPCRYAEETGGLGNFLGVGFDVFFPESLPATISVAIALNLIIPEHELGTLEQIAVEVLDPDLHASEGHTISVRMEDYAHRPDGRQPSSLNILPVALTVEQLGQYTVNLRLQNRVTSVPLFVQRRAA